MTPHVAQPDVLEVAAFFVATILGCLTVAWVVDQARAFGARRLARARRDLENYGLFDRERLP